MGSVTLHQFPLVASQPECVFDETSKWVVQNLIYVHDVDDD